MYGAQSAEREVAEARQRLQSTPRTVLRAIKEPYETGVATYEVVKAYNLPIYLVEAGGVVKRFQMSDVARLEAETEIGVDGRDERKAQVEHSNAAALAKLDQFESAPHGPAPDALLAHVATAQPAAVQPLATLAMQRRADEMTWQRLTLQELSRARAQSAAAEVRLGDYAAADSAPAQQVEVQRLSRHELPRDDLPPATTYDSAAGWSNLHRSGPAGGVSAAAFSGGAAGGMPSVGTPGGAVPAAGRQPATRTAARSGGGGGDCRAEEARITRLLNSVGNGGPSICQSAKEMLQIANQAIPFYERCPINDPDGQMRAWARDTRAKAQHMINESCVAESAPRPRSNADLRGPSRASAPARQPPPAPAPSAPRCAGCGLK
jgi:hypothetical protein